HGTEGHNERTLRVQLRLLAMPGETIVPDRPETLIEVSDALERAREDTSVGVIVLTGEGPLAFCSGGDQSVRGDSGYVAAGAELGRFHVTDLHVQMRRTPKPI
ncbi:hypothetical protein KVQ90_25055, partial [Escherichia coli]|nr:hypothetical protein [Escherichia coli]